MSTSKFDFKTATSAQISKAIGSIGTRAGTLQSDVQQVGLACIKQVIDHSNTTPINALYKALPEGFRRTAFGLWAVRYAGVRLNPSKKTRDVNPLILDDSTYPDLAAALGTNWWTIKTEPTLAQALDAEKAVAGLITRLLKAERDGKVKNPEAIGKLRAAFPELLGKKPGKQKAQATATPVPVVPAVPTVQ